MGDGRFKVLYADPPWAFRTYSAKGKAKSPDRHYKVMTSYDMNNLLVDGKRISEIASDDAALFMWVVQPMLPQALIIMRAWGFEYKTVAFAWVKLKKGQDRLFYAGQDVRMGLGYHTRAGFEQCWLATRGKGYERLTKAEPQVIFAPIREHSRKPDEVALAIERLVGDVPKCELFARTERPGWTAWGLEKGKFK